MVACAFCGSRVPKQLAAKVRTPGAPAYDTDRCRNLAHRAKDALRLLTRADVRAYLTKEGML